MCIECHGKRIFIGKIMNGGLRFILFKTTKESERVAVVAPSELACGGEGGIRTHGDHKGHNGFRDRPDRPLWHLSVRRIIAQQGFFYPG